MIQLIEKNILLEVVDVTASFAKRQVAKITQQLSQQPQKEPTVEIAGIRVPSIFRITLEGTLEGQPFSPLSGTLKILSRHSRDPNPFLVDLSTDLDRVNGGISWTSFVPTRSKKSELNSKIQIERGQVNLNVELGSHFRVGIMWFTFEERASTSKYRHLLAGILIGATATSGNFTFSIQGSRVSGNILASGKTDMGGDPSTYQARLIGQEQEF
jgi:hypothetical protein